MFGSKQYSSRPAMTQSGSLKACGKPFRQNLLDSTAQNGGNNVKLWAPLATSFTRKTSTLAAVTSVSA